MTVEAPAGTGLEESSCKCEQCTAEHGVIDYRGTSLCRACLATMGVWITSATEGESIRMGARQREHDAGKVATENSRERVSQLEEADKARKLQAVEARPRVQVDRARLLKRGLRGSNG